MVWGGRVGKTAHVGRAVGATVHLLMLRGLRPCPLLALSFCGGQLSKELRRLVVRCW